MIQQILIGSVFAVAVSYLGRMLYKSFQATKGCASGCGKCGAIDFEKIEVRVRANQR